MTIVEWRAQVEGEEEASGVYARLKPASLHQAQPAFLVLGVEHLAPIIQNEIVYLFVSLMCLDPVPVFDLVLLLVVRV